MKMSNYYETVLEAQNKITESYAPLSAFLRQSMDAATDPVIKKSFDLQIKALEAKWTGRIKPKNRAAALERLAALRETVELKIKDNRAQYRSKLAAMRGQSC